MTAPLEYLPNVRVYLQYEGYARLLSFYDPSRHKDSLAMISAVLRLLRIESSRFLPNGFGIKLPTAILRLCRDAELWGREEISIYPSRIHPWSTELLLAWGCLPI